MAQRKIIDDPLRLAFSLYLVYPWEVDLILHLTLARPIVLYDAAWIEDSIKASRIISLGSYVIDPLPISIKRRLLDSPMTNAKLGTSASKKRSFEAQDGGVWQDAVQKSRKAKQDEKKYEDQTHQTSADRLQYSSSPPRLELKVLKG